MWTEVSSSVPHFLHMGSLHSHMICKCLLEVLRPVSRPITTLVCVLLNDNSRAPIARSEPEINSRVCLCVLQGPRHNARCLFSIQRCLYPIMYFCCVVFQKHDVYKNRCKNCQLAFCAMPISRLSVTGPNPPSSQTVHVGHTTWAGAKP
jgi:hypothetical protein